MKSEETSLAVVHPFIQRFVFSIIQNIRAKNFSYEERHVLDADMVPRVSEKVMRASLGSRIIHPATELEPAGLKKEGVEIRKRDMSQLIAPIEKPKIVKPTQVPPKVFIPQQPIEPISTPPIRVAEFPISQQKIEGPIDETGKYGKISPLLNDPSVSSIECPGAGKEIMIMRMGQKQKTRIILSEDEIGSLLNTIAEEAHIPLLEGVFRTIVKGFSINAVVSKIIGSKFLIRKATAYGLLE